jgi:hypothetical protein
MQYFMFIDETGETNVTKSDPRYHFFSLCSVVFREDHYTAFSNQMDDLKTAMYIVT